MEKPTRRLAEAVGRSRGSTAEQIAVMAYGLGALGQMLLIGALVLAIGLCFGFAAESMVVFWAVGILRSATGGAHSQSYVCCLVISTAAISLLASAAFWLGTAANGPLLWAACALAMAVCAAVIWRRAPVDTPNKPIRRPQKIARLRRRAFVTLGAYAAAGALLFFLSIRWHPGAGLAVALVLSAMWQTLMLTRGGAAAIRGADRFAAKAKLTLKGGET